MDKLLIAGFIHKVMYPDWLDNMVMVKKNTGKWRMCVDITYLNRVCPNDSFPLLKIDKLVDSTTSFEFLSFLDSNSGYHQISMYSEDKEKTFFIT